jgi:predicted HTH transcriptional regulator
VLKCAETVTRYLAALSISSISAREDTDEHVPAAWEKFAGPLSFGHFLAMTQAATSAKFKHPLQKHLQAHFRDNKAHNTADPNLQMVLNLRNRLGHSLVGMSELQANIILRNDAPEQALNAALEAVAPIICRYPLFLVEEQRLESRKVVARRLLLMGETQDPTPEPVTLSGGLEHNRRLYVGTDEGALCLHPFLIWDVVEARANYGIYLIHNVGETVTKYITVSDDKLDRSGEICDLVQRHLRGEIFAAEKVTLTDGTPFVAEWEQRRQQLQGETLEPVPWADLDRETVRWFGKHLGASGSDEEIQNTIVDRLFDGRDRLNADEIRQVRLLFGSEQTVRVLLKRGMIDCRARKDPDARWNDRVEASKNVLQCLKLAIEFFSKHVGAGTGGVTLDGLRATSGSADYIAMREALVNLFIHQDYNDPSTVAQVEITPERVVCFNAGKSLVNRDALVEGGKSQSRNPILSRALRLIGFAELAGSGLRQVHHAWRQVKRRPPSIESNEASNTFTLSLDWRPLPDVSDEFWKKHLGVRLTAQQARALFLASDPFGVNIDELASYLGVMVDEAANVYGALLKEVLVYEQDGRIYIKDHLKPLAEQARAQ